MPSSDHASKLHLKETPHDRLRREEKLFRRAARQARKEERRANRASTSTSHSSSSHHAPPPPRRSASPPPNYQAYHRSQFEQHLRDLAAQDEGRASELSSWETGDYGTGVGWGDEATASSIPKRWASREDNVWNDPLSGGAAGQGGLDEDSYAEEMRAGMYRRKNPESVKRTERLAEEAERTAARLLKMTVEGDKLERERIKKLEARKGERVEKRFEEEREAFEQGWKRMLAAAGDEKRELRWREIPWPVHRVEVGKEVKVGDMTVPAVREFLMPSKVFWELEEEEGKRRRKEVLRDAIRRYHPDKFSRYLQRVPEKEKEKVQQGVAQVSRVLMELMQAG